MTRSFGPAPAARALLVAASVVFTVALAAPAARAEDSSPCGKEVFVSWSSEPVQPCPLTSPTGPNNGIPVYATPVPNPAGHAPPAPASWLYGTTNKYFVCDREVPAAAFFHPQGWWNTWWAYTRSDEGKWGWVPEVYFAGGANNEPDFGLRACPPPSPPPGSPQPQPAPSPAPAPPPPVSPCEPAPLVHEVKIRASFGHDRRVITVPYGQRPWVTGRVVARDGSPLAGTDLCVGVQRRANGLVKAVASIQTDADGRFRVRLDRGVSRRVWLVHRLGSAAVAASVRVRVRAPVVLGASSHDLRNGQAVKLRGRLPFPVRARLLVELQALRGRHWQTFATTRTRGGGHFRYRYRFTRTFSAQRYKLRARVAGQAGSPFATGASAPVSILVRG